MAGEELFIENKAPVAMGWYWDGDYWTLPPGQHKVSRLWPGRTDIADQAVQRAEVAIDTVNGVEIRIFSGKVRLYMAMEEVEPPDPPQAEPEPQPPPAEEPPPDEEEDDTPAKARPTPRVHRRGR